MYYLAPRFEQPTKEEYDWIKEFRHTGNWAFMPTVDLLELNSNSSKCIFFRKVLFQKLTKL